jgi:hypothetical protein
MEEKSYEEKSIIERYTLDKGFSLTGALVELDARCKAQADRIILLEATLLEYLEKPKSPIITVDTPKIELLRK